VSGIKQCALVLSALGIQMAGERLPQQGGWGSRAVTDFHERVLGLFDRDSASPLRDLTLPAAWWADPRIHPLRREITAALQRECAVGGGVPLGFADPRTARLLPLWRLICRDLRLVPKFVLCLENPALGAEAPADPLAGELAEFRWFVAMIDVFKNVNNDPLCIVHDDDWEGEAAPNLAKLTQFFGVSAEEVSVAATAELVEAIRRMPHAPTAEPRQPLMRSLYRWLCRYAQDTDAREQIGTIVHHFTVFQQLQRPVYRAFESLYNDHPVVREQEKTLAHATDEIAALRASIVHARQHGAESVTALEGAHAEAAERGAALEDAQAEIGSLRSNLEAEQAEIALLRSGVEATERSAAQSARRRAARLELTTAALASFRSALADIGTPVPAPPSDVENPAAAL
jgi:hypothetical protein